MGRTGLLLQTGRNKCFSQKGMDDYDRNKKGLAGAEGFVGRGNCYILKNAETMKYILLQNNKKRRTYRASR